MTPERGTLLLVDLNPTRGREQRGVRSIDKRRVRRQYGRLRPEEIEAIDDGLRLYFGI